MTDNEAMLWYKSEQSMSCGWMQYPSVCSLPVQTADKLFIAPECVLHCSLITWARWDWPRGFAVLYCNFRLEQMFAHPLSTKRKTPHKNRYSKTHQEGTIIYCKQVQLQPTLLCLHLCYVVMSFCCCCEFISPQYDLLTLQCVDM